jgi:hypothetical protein
MGHWLLFAAFSLLLITTVLAGDPSDTIFHVGVPWIDTRGERLYANAGSLLLDDGVYYLIGQGHLNLTVPGDTMDAVAECLNLYSSTDLATWDYRGCLLRNEDVQASIAPDPFYRIARPKLFRCPGTGKYVIFFHCDTFRMQLHSLGVLTSDTITGPYTFASPCFHPDNSTSYDIGLFLDTQGDGLPYYFRSVDNVFGGISGLTAACTNTTGIVSRLPRMEAFAAMRDTASGLHVLGSNLAGWPATYAEFVSSNNASFAGAEWDASYNPSGDATTFNSQSAFIFPFVHSDGHTTYIYIADRWNVLGPGGLANASNIWLPLLPPNATNPRWSLQWLDSWRLRDY